MSSRRVRQCLSRLVVMATFLLLTLLGTAPAQAEEKKTVVVEGIVTYSGPIPKGITINETNAVRQRVEVDAKTKGLKDAFVWLEGVPLPDGFKKAQPKKVVLDQLNFVFKPHVLSIVAGQEVEFRNSDSANHCVQAFSIKNENSFNILMPPEATESRKFVADKMAVQLKCPIHPSMGAWIRVYDHPFHTVTNASGTFRLPPVPPGKYTVQIRHLDGGMKKTQPITVKEGQPLALTIEFGKDDLKIDD